MNIVLRPLCEQDALTSIKWRNDARIWAYTERALSREITLEDELAWIRRVMADDTSRRFAILADDRYVGNIYLTDIRGGTAEYHVFIGDAGHWGRGVARRASEQIIDFGKSVLALHTIRLKAHRMNEAAVRLYKSLGFTIVGEEGAFLCMRLDLRRWPVAIDLVQ